MNETELRRLMQTEEGESLEFKRSLLSRKAIGEYAVGIGNQGGGWLIMGVTDARPRRVSDLSELSVSDLQRIRDGVLEATGIRVEACPLETSDGWVLAIEIPGRPRGHIFSTRAGKYLTRTGEGLRGMSLAEMEAIRRTELRHEDSLAESVGASWQEVVDPLEMKRLERVLIDNGRAALARLEGEELLRSLELLARSPDGLTATRAAVLLLGTPEAIRQHVPWHEIKLQRYGRQELTTSFNEDLRTPLLGAFQRVCEMIALVNTVESFLQGMVRVDVPKFPEVAYREAVANALIHRDYERSGNVAVRIYEDRLEVSNPGGWFGGVDESNLLASESQRRNELLASVMQRIGFAERSALGVRRMYEAMLTEGKGPPEYRSTSASVTITLRNGALDRAFAGLTRRLTDEGVDFSVFDLLILSYLRRRSQIDVAAAAALCQQSEEGARRLLDALGELGLLESRGTPEAPAWSLSPRIHEELG